MTRFRIPVGWIVLFCFPCFASEPSKLPPSDTRAKDVRTLNTPRQFPEITTKAAWEKRARQIREQALVSCGLWPAPERGPLAVKVFDRVERDGYSIEKVQIKTLRCDFYLCGNLYRPIGKGNGPFPGILNPHGHWKEGRMANTELGSIAARCINFAKQGMVAFSYDMVGYNDTAQVNHKFASDLTNQLWNVSLMGLQTWNSLRALDFLESLPDVDKDRLACTGESGGGTQTFMLGAIDDRLRAQAPVVMVSHSMQGGCLCENAPGLRVEHSNMEITAVPAPRPQILVAASGDWTKTTTAVEGPAVESVYKLFGAGERLRYATFNFDHNYNRTSREAVYAFFGKWLLNHAEPASIREAAYEMEPVRSLRLFPDEKPPDAPRFETEVIAELIKRDAAQLESLRPRDAKGLEKFKAAMEPAWRHSLLVEFPERSLVVEPSETTKIDKVTKHSLFVGRKGRGDRLPVVMFTPAKDNLRVVCVLAHPDGKSTFIDDNGAPRGLAKELVTRNHSVVLLDTFLTGELANPEASKARRYSNNYFTTYNRTDVQERVQDLITVCAFAQTHGKGRRVVLVGAGRAGLWAQLAAPAADAVIADCAAIDLSNDAELMKQDLFAPGLRRIGAFQGASLLAAPNPLLLHNTGVNFPTEWLQAAYANNNAFRREVRAMDDATVAEWLLSLKLR